MAQTALITGASRGIGRETALLLAGGIALFGREYASPFITARKGRKRKRSSDACKRRARMRYPFRPTLPTGNR